ncbi:MAG: carboxylating nicotinate-nucleotide diphosphorylase [Rickettsiaceae bacterium]|nr:carboxylating nicotinate-nucleotide diphosphorylase [Rickettsiaceae bacterium]MDP4832220.1 carboxylating nicotinate-nucleotide diphosphorylase [Rickettsiaceae bacterium]MDP5020992.1 carboxylating nicotinate-nucleotide diphosphorylase [Rickettsiaceae bacterium]MDP5082661.1 carboxylating nicotinate-nucleotide diphosphorylase [Rickettsiaceae bacterium]
MTLQINVLKDSLDISFKEDYGIKGDITSDSVIDKESQVSFEINTREEIIICGLQIAQYYFDTYSSIKYKLHCKDSDLIQAGSVILSGSGSARELLLLERVVLNYLQHISGISTVTHAFVQKIKGTKAKIFDTRKTTPLYRSLQKYAVLCGGGHNHRLCLDSSILIKDNHIAICGGITKALEKAKANNPHYAKIEIECDTLEQVAEAASFGVDIIMLDNMSIKQIIEAISIIDNRAIIEVSGNVSLETVADIAKTGVDMISIGKITHSAPSVDIGLDIV